MRAICVNSFGRPEVFTLTEIDRPTPAATQVLVQVTVAGVNYLDVYQRTGVSPIATPYLAGVEGVGLIVEVGSEVTDLFEGQRVGWLTGGQGSFADYTVVEAARAVPIPDEVDNELAAAVLMQGVTAHYLATDTYPIRPGDPVLVHAAAGGVGQLLVQVAKLRGGMVIGTISTEAKAEAARAAGADHVISYDNFADQVRNLTDGYGVAVVYDGIGATTFEGRAWRRSAPEAPWGLWDSQWSHSAAGNPSTQLGRIAVRHQTLGRALHRDHRRAPPPYKRHHRLGDQGGSHGQHRRSLPNHANQ